MDTTPFRRILTRTGTAAASPAAFAIVIVYAGLWAVFERDTLDWHGYATLATWMMTLFIQRAEHRDTQALHAKLDELLKKNKDADNDLRHIDKAEPEEVEAKRADINR
jgi:low affinity Fe/Cu permease